MQQAFPIAQSEARVNFFDHHTIIYQNKTFLDIIIFIANRSSAVTVTGMPQEDITVAVAELLFGTTNHEKVIQCEISINRP
jgi:hypothetical protein